MRTALLLSGLLVWPVFAGDECFCLVDADDYVWFECREQKRPLHTQPRVFCTDANTEEQVDLTGRQGFERVADGDEHCRVFRS